jgi:TonB family protein
MILRRAPFIVLASSALAVLVSSCATAPDSSVGSQAGSPANASTRAPVLEPMDAVEISKLDNHPIPISRVQPNYPFEMRRKRIAGEAVVDFIVDTQGNVRNAYAIRTPHPVLGDAAVACVMQWKFRPGRKGGRPVNTHMQVPIIFSLNPR